MVDGRRVAGQGRYAQLEREQRWLLEAMPSGAVAAAAIHDRYLVGTRLRLRRVESDGVATFKLGQKVRVDERSPELVKLTNIYLSAGEYERLSELPGADLHKTRWRLPAGADAPRGLCIDEFHGELAGLVLAEIELAADVALLPLPPFALADVTDDDRFSGGALAAMSTADLRVLLAGIG